MHNFDSFYERIYQIGIVPVIKLDNVEHAPQLAQALVSGGILCAEVTFRAQGADKAIAKMIEACPQMLVGAGTVTTVEQVDRAVAAGAKFCVAPGLNVKVAKHCVEQGVPFMPGVSGCSEIEQALENGFEVLKFFPAEQAGGLDYIKAVCAPYTSIRFMPTGGVNEKNINQYLAYEKILACGGSFMVPAKLIEEQNWAEITRLSRAAVQTILGFELAHVGINCADEQAAHSDAQVLGAMFGLDAREGNSSVFAGSQIELCKSAAFGAHGHIAIRTLNLARAVFQLKQRGFDVREQSFKFDKKGKAVAVYLQNEVSGFAIHLIQA